MALLWADADNDNWCTGPDIMQCTGLTPPPGLKFTNGCTYGDCNDNNASLFRSWSVRPDGDGDGYCFGPTTMQCGSNSPPMGFRQPTQCNATDDCRDTNPLANVSCTLVGAYTTTSATKTCAFVPPTQSFTVSIATACPLGFVLGAYTANKTAGNGTCTATSELTLSMSCNGLDGATCNIVGHCNAL